MSLYLLLLALQSADAPLDPPPLKVKPVVAAKPAPAAPKFAPASPKANPTIIYAPAAKPTTAPPAVEPEVEVALSPSGLSQAAVNRILAERKANAERQAAHRQELAAAQKAVAAALSADPFDLAALRAALIERDRINGAYRDKLTAAVLAMLEEMPAAERVAVARAVIQGEGIPRAAAADAPPKPKPSPVGR